MTEESEKEKDSKSKEFDLPPEAEAPMSGTKPIELDEAVKKGERECLEHTLLQVELERRQAMLRLGNDNGFKQFSRVTGLAAVAFSVGYFFTTDGETDVFNFGALGPYMLILLVAGAVGSIYGNISLADTKGELAVKARDDDHGRVLRAIKRLEDPRLTESDSASSGHSAEEQAVSTPKEASAAAVDHDSGAPSPHHG